MNELFKTSKKFKHDETGYFRKGNGRAGWPGLRKCNAINCKHHCHPYPDSTHRLHHGKECYVRDMEIGKNGQCLMFKEVVK